MKTLKHSTQNCLAVVTETTVYLSNLEGKIYKHFPIQHFQVAPFAEEVKFPTDFETEKKAYNIHQANKNQERIEKHNAWVATQREIRKLNIINLWNWRKGSIGAYRIRTVNQPVELFNKNPNIEGSWEDIFFGTYEEAKEMFDATIGSWSPEFDDSLNNVQGEVCLYSCEIYPSERLEITLIDKLQTWFDEFNVEPIEDEWFSKELPENAIIVSMDERRGSFNRRYSVPSDIHMVGDYLGSYSIGYRKIENYSDLWEQEVFEDLQELIEKYRDNNTAELIRSKFTRENALKYGLSEVDAEWIYEETEE